MMICLVYKDISKKWQKSIPNLLWYNISKKIRTLFKMIIYALHKVWNYYKDFFVIDNRFKYLIKEG